MKYLSLFVVSIIVFVFLFFYLKKNESNPIAEKNIFNSETAAEYFSSQGYLPPNSSEEAILLNKLFIKKIRSTNDPEIIKQMFLGADLTASYQIFLNQFIPPFTGGDFSFYLMESLKKLKADPHFKKNKTTLSDDSYTEGNLPFLQFRLPNSYKTAVIRMGLPMKEESYVRGLIGDIPLNSEFLKFVQSQNKHLYVNLMKREGLEWPATRSLENYDKAESHMAVVTLDKNTNFYWQEGDFPEEIHAFKTFFYQKLKDPKSGYYWTKKLNPQALDAGLVRSMDEVHAYYFKDKIRLSQEERQNFIELTYLEILDFLTEHLQPDSVNITCKHAIDRGPSLSVLWQCKHLDVDKNEIAALLLAPPLLMHNRTSHESRIKRFSSAYFLLSQKNETR